MEAGHQDPEMLIYLEWSHMLRVFFILFLADLKTGLKTSNAHLIPVHLELETLWVGFGFKDESIQSPVKSVNLPLAISIMPQGILGNELLLNFLVLGEKGVNRS